MLLKKDEAPAWSFLAKNPDNNLEIYSGKTAKGAEIMATKAKMAVKTPNSAMERVLETYFRKSMLMSVTSARDIAYTTLCFKTPSERRFLIFIKIFDSTNMIPLT